MAGIFNIILCAACLLLCLYIVKQWQDMRHLQCQLLQEREKNARQQEILDNVLESIPSGVWVGDKDFNILMWNKGQEDMTGILRQEVIGLNIFERFPSLGEAGLEELYRNVVRTGERLERDTVGFYDETLVKKQYYLNIKAHPMHNSKGEIVGIMVAVEDFTQRKLVEIALRESEDQYRTVVETLPYALWVQKDDRILYINEAAMAMLRIDSWINLEDWNIYDFIYRDDWHKVREFMNDLNAARERNHNHKAASILQTKLVCMDGAVIDIQALSTFITYGGYSAILVVGHDITEYKKTEELKQRMEEKTRLLNETLMIDKFKTEFFTNISHELRTPLNIITSTLQLFQLYIRNNIIHDDDNKISKYISTMEQNCYRLLRLISNIIDITKIESGYIELDKKNYDIVGLVIDIAYSVDEFIHNKGIKFTYDILLDEAVICCDEEKIERIMLNIISNAVKFTQPGGQIRVQVQRVGPYIEIAVEDTGIGIPKDKLEVIFDRFRQVDKSFTRSHEGSGIGLSLVKSLVELHKGFIKVESEYGKGSRFMVYLPDIRLEEDHKEESSEERIQKRIEAEFSDIYL